MNVVMPPVLPVPIMSERRVSLLGALFVALGPVSMAIYTPAMPQIVTDFASTPGIVKLTLTLYFGGFAFGQLLAGPLSDAYGRRPVILGFVAIYVLASVAALFSTQVEMLIAARFMQGIGASAGIAIGRALVRDLYVGDQSSRIMNLMAIILALGPSLSPTVGGLLVPLFGWQSLFVAMTALGIGSILVAMFGLRETITADATRFNVPHLLRSYCALAMDRHFLTFALIIGGSSGAIFAQATFLPFIMMDQVGLSPPAFGLGMLFQSGSFLLGSIVMRVFMRRHAAIKLVRPGMVMMVAGHILLLPLIVNQPSLLGVMGPIAISSFGIAFFMPWAQTLALAPFGSNAGAAAALLGFVQMGSGLLIGSIGALYGDPRLALATLIPAMGISAFLVWIGFVNRARKPN